MYIYIYYFFVQWVSKYIHFILFYFYLFAAKKQFNIITLSICDK